MANTVGRIDLDLGINTSGFKNQLNGIKSQGKGLSGVFGKLGKVIGAAFAVKAVASFAKSCIDLGSDLQEVQNVVDVTFGSMSSKVNEFAKNAMTSFGMSEKVAKDYMGQFGAMSKAFGNTEQMAYDQAAALTGLAGDVASFYNMSTDEAFTKLKAVYTGETEALKSLGVVMTQTALDEFALQKGLGKTTKQMSEQEKVALRLQFVTDRLSGASGDFVRTADGWANQTRVLSLRFDALKASIGQGLINVLTPVIRLLNQLVAKLQVAADAFRDFTTAIFGDAGSSSSSGSSIAAASEASGAIADNVDSAAGAAKKLKKQLAGFDKLNVLGSSDSDSGSGGTSSGGMSAGSSPLGEVEPAANSAVGALDTFKRKLEEIAAWTGFDRLWTNIKTGIDKIDFSAIKTNFESIWDSLQPIASAAFSGVSTISQSVMSAIGTSIGQQVALIGKSIEIASGGVSRFLESQSSVISTWITTTSGKIASGFDNLSFGAENIFGSFWTALDTNQVAIETAISNMLSSFSTAGMTIGTIFADMWAIVTENFATWTSENKPLMDEFFSGITESLTYVSDTVSYIVGDLFTVIGEWWETNGKPVWDKISKVFGDIIAIVMKLWNTVLKPIIDNITKNVKQLWNTTLKPIVQNVLGFFSDVGELLVTIWNNVLKPVVTWIVEKLGPPIVKIVNKIGDVFTKIGKAIGGVINGLITSLRGIIQFLTGVFSGDWKKALDGVKTMFKGCWDSIKSIFGGIGTWFKDKFSAAWKAVKNVFSGVGSFFSGIWNTIKSKFTAIGTSIGNAIGSAFKKVVNSVIQFAENTINGFIKAINGAISLINKIPGVNIKKLSLLDIPKLATGGYVAANTPQLAVIGDNKHEGEIVAPESKIAEAVARGFAMVMSRMQQPTQQRSNSTPVVIKIGETNFWEGFIDFHNSVVRRTGESPLLV